MTTIQDMEIRITNINLITSWISTMDITDIHEINMITKIIDSME